MNTFLKICLYVMAFWFGLTVIAALIIPMTVNQTIISNTTNVQHITTPSQEPSHDVATVKIGDNGYLHIDGTTPILASYTKDAMNKAWSAYNIHDNYGLQNLIDTNQIVTLPDGTKVLLIGTSFSGLYHVRILSGQYAGNAAWIASNTFKE